MRTVPLVTVLAVLAVTPPALAEELPSEARLILSAFDRTASAIREKAEREVDPHRQKAIAALQALQDSLCRAGKLDEAVAVREQLRALAGIRTDPGLLRASEEDIGKSFLYQVTGATSGAVWGSEVYTSDSHLGAAAVHAGVVEPGQKAVVRVRIIRGPPSYAASTRNGVSTSEYGAWPVAFTVERAAR